MPRKNQEQPDVPPFEYRAGVTIPAIGGMYRRGDPTQIPPHRLHLGVNIRLADNEAGSRPGLTQVEGTAENACITGIFEIDDFAVAIYITQLADAALDPVTGLPVPSDFRILAFNEEKDPVAVNYWDAAGTFAKAAPSPWRTVGALDAFNTFQAFNDILLIANFKDVYQAEFSEDDGVPRLDLSHRFTLPESAAGNIVSTCVRRERVDDPQTGAAFDKDVLYMGCEGGEIWRYDGTTVELAHTLTNGEDMQIISWRGTGLVAAGDTAAGFSYQEQPGFAWVDQAWGQDFSCNGLCEFLGDVAFVGDALGESEAYALHWNGAGAPVVFASRPLVLALNHRYRTPVVSGGALHWLHFEVETLTPPDDSLSWIARFTDYATGDDKWADIGTVAGPGLNAPGFFIPYAGAMLLLSRNAGPAAQWPTGDSIVLVFSDVAAIFELVHNFPLVSGQRKLQPGEGHEAIAL